MKKSAVLLVNFGGPRSLDEVPEFMRLLTGRSLAVDARQQAIERYRLIGDRSPLPSMAEQHATLLEAALGGRLIVRTAFKYSHPFIEESIDWCRGEGVERIAFFIMTPFYTSRTAGNYIATATNRLRALHYEAEVLFIHSWYKEPLFVGCWISKIREQAPSPDAFFLFSAHSLPRVFEDEPYKKQIEETVERVAGDLGLRHYRLAWQSVPARATEPWIGPAVEAVIDEVAEKKQFRVIVQVPIGFVTDHLETLYDIDILHKKYAATKGLDHVRVSCPNADPAFIEALKQILSRSLQEAA